MDLFNELEKYEKLKLIDGLKVVQFSAGECILNEGDKGENFYIVEKGEIECGKVNKEGKFEVVR